MYKTTLEKIQLTDNLFYQIQISHNEEMLFLHINFMNGRFVIEKSFRNNYLELEKLKQNINLFDTEEKIINYLKIEDVQGVNKNNE